VTICGEVRSCEIRNTLNVETSLFRITYRETPVRPCEQNISGKIGEARPASYTHKKNGPEVDDGPGGVITSLTLLDPVLV